MATPALFCVLPTLLHCRRTVPTLGGLHWTGGCRLGAIAETLGAGRASLRQAARHLIDSGLIMEDPARAGVYTPADNARKLLERLDHVEEALTGAG